MGKIRPHDAEPTEWFHGGPKEVHGPDQRTEHYEKPEHDGAELHELHIGADVHELHHGANRHELHDSAWVPMKDSVDQPILSVPGVGRNR